MRDGSPMVADEPHNPVQAEDRPASGQESLPSLEIEAPDLSPYAAGTHGLPYVMSFEASRPGPHVVLTALVHGNELCGALALDRLLRDRIRPGCGRLSFVFANVDAFLQFDPRYPYASRYVDEDLNRLWLPQRLNGREISRELARARQLRPLLEGADYLLDLHSMQTVSDPLILAGLQPKGRALAERLALPATVVMDGGHPGGVRLRDYGPFADPGHDAAAVLIECGQHWAAAAMRFALAASARFLALAGMMPEDWAALYGEGLSPLGPRHPKAVQVTETITAATDHFTFVHPFRGLERLPKAGTLIAYDGNTPVLTPYDDCVLVMPSRRMRKGQTAVRLGYPI